MGIKTGFIILWSVLGWLVAVLPFYTFSVETEFFIFLSVYFLVFLSIQYTIQKQQIKEAHLTHTWERSPLRQFSKSFLVSIVVGAGQAGLLGILSKVLFENHVSFQNFYSHCFTVSIFQSIFLTFMIQIKYLNRQRSFLKKESKGFKYLSKVTQKKALQDLVSPHFLFNSLNTAASIIPDDKATGMRFVTELTDLYGFILKNNENQLITLNEEIEIVEKYGFLIQTRFGAFFQIKLEVASEYQTALIPPLGLQNLVENASKHNAVTRKKPLLLEIFIEGDDLVVRNNINPKKTFSEESTNLGLDYIQSQIANFSKRKMKIEHGEEFFVVKIPLIYPSDIN